MIDKVPETTVLECTLPKLTVERLRSLARQRRQTMDDMLSEAINQSCIRWELEASLVPAEAIDPECDFPAKRGTPIEIKHTASPRPDPPMFDECQSIPVELPGSSATPIKVTRTVKQWPERLHEDA